MLLIIIAELAALQKSGWISYYAIVTRLCSSWKKSCIPSKMSSVVQLFLLILLTISSVNSRQLTLVYTAEYIDDLVVITLQNADEESTDHVS